MSRGDGHSSARQVLLLLGVLLLAQLTGGCESWSAPPIRVDLSSPKSAAMAYLKAVQAGDARTARAACFGTSEQMQWVDGRATLVDGMRKFDNALYARFGNVTSQEHTDMHDSLLKLADIWVTAISDGIVAEDGDNARIDPARHGFFTHFVNSIYLQRKKEGWQVDLAQTYAQGIQPEDYAQISADHKQWREFGTVLQGVARDVRGGSFRSADAAGQALYERLEALRQSQDE